MLTRLCVDLLGMPNSEVLDRKQRIYKKHEPKQKEEQFAPMDLTKMQFSNSAAAEVEAVPVEEVNGVAAFTSPQSSISAVGMPIDSADSSCCGEEKVDPSSLEFDASEDLLMTTTRGIRTEGDPPELVQEVAQETCLIPTLIPKSDEQSQQFSMQRQMQLEERIEELELKLSVLSRLLQQQPNEAHRYSSPSKTLFSPITASFPRSEKTPSPPLLDSLQIPTTDERVLSQPLHRLDHEGGSLRKNRVAHEEDSRIAYRELTTFSPHLESPALTFSKMTPRREAHFIDTDEKVECHSPVVYPSSSTIPHLESPAVIFSESKDEQHRRLDFSLLSPEPVPNSQMDTSNGSQSSTISPSEKSHRRKNRNLSLLVLFEGNQEEYDKECHSVAPELSSMTPAERQWLRPQLQQYLQEQRDNQRGQKEEEQTDLSVINQVERETKMMSHLDLTPPAANHRPTVVRMDETIDKSESDLLSQQEERVSRNRSQSITDDVNLLRKKVRTKWLEYLNSVQESAPDVDVQMEEFIKVPAAVETIMSYGFFICVDSFLYMFTVLPIRFIWSCLLLVIKVSVGRGIQASNPHFQFHRRHLYQLIQVFILFVIYRYVLVPISIGKLYHWIRGQSMIKLYVIIAMVEIFDRLFSSLGQDCLDSMYWNTVSRPRSRRFVVSVVVVLLYAAFHALILFVHVATLNVAMNSADHALLTLLISGNFAEIKSTVFKKYNKAALFKITAQDVCERFKLGLFLSLVLLLNVCQGMDQNQFLSYMRICGLVWCSEIIADWIKHAFISKFNFLPARVYPEYALLLAGDVTGIGHEGMSLDHSHAVVKRIGFAQIPLLCVMFRLLKEAAKYAKSYRQTLPNNPLYVRVLLAPFAASSARRQVIAYFCVWTMLLISKLVLGRLLQTISLEKLYAAPEYSQLTPLFTKPAKKKTI